MATIGLRRPMYAPITEEADQTMPLYGTPVMNNKAISASISWTRNDSSLYADDIEAETDNGITGGELTFGLDDLSPELQTAALGVLRGGAADDYHYEDTDRAGTPGGFAFLRVRKRNGVLSFEGNFLFKVILGQTDEETSTRGQSIEWQTPELTGSIMGIYIDNSGVAKFRRRKSFATEADAVTWINAIFAGTETISVDTGTNTVIADTETEGY